MARPGNLVANIGRMMSPRVATARRPIDRLPRDKDGLFIEPDHPDWAMLAHNRERAVHHFNYADEFCGDRHSWDTQGDYNCGRCNMAEGDRCLLLAISRIDRAAGSCEDWEEIRPDDAEFLLNRKKPAVASYGVAVNGSGFGCQRCPYSRPAKNKDAQGRSRWCGELGCHIQPNACCTNNGVPVKAS
jgi:hypothetical protein